ncbi:MAG: histidinol dehydrogenase [Sinobacteraceae bacterium]|nr:histidinol dehydrogenase [Nevskiaceae bacterium]
MQIYDWSRLSGSERKLALSRPAQRSREEVTRTVQEIIAAVRRDGDAALQAMTEQFDGVRPEPLAVTRAEFADARSALNTAQHAALERAIDNVQRFHAAQLPQPLSMQTMSGVHCERLIRPIPTVGLYVPAGSAPLPSAVIMLAVPARIAGCATRLLCTPPARTGYANAAVLVAAELCGVTEVFKVGGAQAIAALAYGTATIPKAAKIFGPGNMYVTAAKQLVASDPDGAACDLPAGPSEVMVLADETARADFVAADLLAQAEHDPQSQALLVCNSQNLAESVSIEVSQQSAHLSRQNILARSLQSSRCILVSDMRSAVAVANEYAAEHLILQVREPRELLADIVNAGSVFLGSWSPEPLGDYCSGTNHVLPTYGYARAYSGLSVQDFVRGMTVQELSPAGLRALGPTAVELARLEGLDAHANAVTQRLRALGSAAHP